jgi:hypothetical protein
MYSFSFFVSLYLFSLSVVSRYRVDCSARQCGQGGSYSVTPLFPNMSAAGPTRENAPIDCVFGELIEFYLDDTTVCS